MVGSGAGVNAGADLLRFHARTKKPIGIFGATTDSFNFTNFADGDASIDVQALRACPLRVQPRAYVASSDGRRRRR
jgi:hypothetical protein